jgi:hypothetical protein
MNETTQEVATLRYLNESAVHAHALECSRRNRAGKFTRVSQDFQDEVRVDVEGIMRRIRNEYAVNHVHPKIETDLTFVTYAMLEKIRDDLNAAIASLIQGKVQRQPSVGKTLGRTR